MVENYVGEKDKICSYYFSLCNYDPDIKFNYQVGLIGNNLL